MKTFSILGLVIALTISGCAWPTRIRPETTIRGQRAIDSAILLKEPFHYNGHTLPAGIYPAESEMVGKIAYNGPTIFFKSPEPLTHFHPLFRRTAKLNGGIALSEDPSKVWMWFWLPGSGNLLEKLPSSCPIQLGSIRKLSAASVQSAQRPAELNLSDF
jgi:hypothetical protein